MPEDELHTRETLLIRLRDSADDSSWAEFVEIYTPLLYGFCRKRELKHADTADIVQNVMRSVSLAMKGFEYDRTKGSFKGWLFTALRNAINSHYRKQASRPITAHETSMLERIETTPDPREVDDWEKDYRGQLLAWAIEKIQPEFSERIWNIFEQTALHDRRNLEVANETGMSENAIAVAKHRVIKRLREKIEAIDAERWEEEMILRHQNV